MTEANAMNNRKANGIAREEKKVLHDTRIDSGKIYIFIEMISLGRDATLLASDIMCCVCVYTKFIFCFVFFFCNGRCSSLWWFAQHPSRSEWTNVWCKQQRYEQQEYAIQIHRTHSSKQSVRLQMWTQFVAENLGECELWTVVYCKYYWLFVVSLMRCSSVSIECFEWMVQTVHSTMNNSWRAN